MILPSMTRICSNLTSIHRIFNFLKKKKKSKTPYVPPFGFSSEVLVMIKKMRDAQMMFNSLRDVVNYENKIFYEKQVDEWLTDCKQHKLF